MIKKIQEFLIVNGVIDGMLETAYHKVSLSMLSSLIRDSDRELDRRRIHKMALKEQLSLLESKEGLTEEEEYQIIVIKEILQELS
jgi:hypothetical protein